MKSKFIYFIALLITVSVAHAQDIERLEFIADSLNLSDEETEDLISFKLYSDSLENTFTYIYDRSMLNGDVAKIMVPEGYKFLDSEQAQRVLSDIWGNPRDESVMGLLLKEDESPVETTYAIEISYSEDGYIEDDDAQDMDYDDLLSEMQDDVKEANPQRTSMGYPTVDLIGWATKPYYDSKNKKLYWAKELLFEEEETSTLNYNIRVLGRKGYMNLNVIGDMDTLEDVENNLDPILGSVSFNTGYKYSEFDPDFDDVAAYGIGGLIAGKILAKAGFFALILKFWKFIAIGGVALFAGAKKFFFGSKEQTAIEVRKNDSDIS
ncbi:DUF2167 domain-containing protein [Maribacter stanieri]|jgi:uncharacterized membrane-anchored protein|uniref:DUF2167 domain-containing protein n=1 Tax=Maribacter stanieri TaxID=440514 RepID=UPI0030DB8932|tara:strand:- start:70 stop:1035 length:966 start_codon:yes stop_codon:yes gene_type:complete